jgi:proteasome accessory factor C
MNKFDRIFDLCKILKGRRTPISVEALADRLECSVPTAKRAIGKLRDELGAPIETVRGRGYLLRDDTLEGPFELPGLWFNDSELYALLMTNQFLGQVEPGLFKKDIEPLKKRIVDMLGHRHAGGTELIERVRMAANASRPIDRQRFRQCCTSLSERTQMDIHYHARSSDQQTTRTISPQRLTHYRDNWYLDAWCHQRKGLRRFALDRIESIEIRKDPAREIDARELRLHDAAYGIFSGTGSQTAVIRFSARRARWVAEETWHPDQAGRWLEDGRYELSIPYDDPTELVMDLLRHGPEAEVIQPTSLRQAVAERLRQTLSLYSEENSSRIKK